MLDIRGTALRKKSKRLDDMMQENVSVKTVILALLLLVVPWIIILIGILLPVENAWFFLLAITWFCSGLVFFSVAYIQ